MSKLWVIVLGVVVAAVVAVGVYLNLGNGQSTLPQAMASDPDALQVEIGQDELVIGDAAAPVAIIEYASLTCPHCANFHANVLPQVKEDLLDTGKAKLVFRDFPLDQLALRASMLVRCGPPAGRPAMLKMLFQTQSTWARSEDPVAALTQIGRAAGMSDSSIEACFKNQEVVDAVVAQRLEAEQKYKINSTPSFIIGGKLYGGGITAEQIAELVASQTP